MPPDLALAISSLLGNLKDVNGKFLNKIPKVYASEFVRVCNDFLKCIDYKDTFLQYRLGEKLHCLASLKSIHPAPCVICGKPTKISSTGFVKRYCSVKCRSEDSLWLERRKETCIEKYGKFHAFDGGRANREKTNLERYGGLSPFSAKEIRDKSKITLMHRYGVDNISLSKEQVEKRAASKRLTFLNKVAKEKNLTPLFSINDYNGLKRDSKLTWKCNLCGTEFISRWENYRPHCPKCEPKKSVRTLQGVLYQEMLKHVSSIRFNDRTIISPKEIDLLFYEHKLAVELNGFYWHRDNDITEEKRDLIKQLGYKFMMFFEDEIQNKLPIVISMIKHKLGISSVKISARKCELVHLFPKEAKKFLDENHLTGAINASTYIGLRYNDELVAVGAFGLTRFSKDKSIMELLRFCCKLEHSVRGAFSRIINEFKRYAKRDKILIFADRRLDPKVPNNAIEQKNGFVIWDNKNKKRVHRLAASKKNLSKILDTAGKTQTMLMEELQLYKIPTLGVFKYEE